MRARIGSAKAAVLPVPVWARPTTSRPCISSGMVSCWIAEGCSKPTLRTAATTSSGRLSVSKPGVSSFSSSDFASLADVSSVFPSAPASCAASSLFSAPVASSFFSAPCSTLSLLSMSLTPSLSDAVPSATCASAAASAPPSAAPSFFSSSFSVCPA